MDLFGRKKRREKMIVEEFRLRLRDEIIDVTTRALQAGRTADMRRLQDEIMRTIHAKVLAEVAEKHRLLPGDVRELLARHPENRDSSS